MASSFKRTEVKLELLLKKYQLKTNNMGKRI